MRRVVSVLICVFVVVCYLGVPVSGKKGGGSGGNGGGKGGQQQARATGVDIAHRMGYTPAGVSKGSLASKGMGIEARANDGGVPKMGDGGITASMQSIGATCDIKPQAAASIQAGLARAGNELPSQIDN